MRTPAGAVDDASLGDVGHRQELGRSIGRFASLAAGVAEVRRGVAAGRA